MIRRLALLLTPLLLAPVVLQDTGGAGPSPVNTAWRTAGSESDSGTCYSNDTAHTVADVAAGDAPPQSGRVEGFCIDSFRLSNFGFTTGDVPASSTINEIHLHYQAHGGTQGQSNRRRVDVWVVEETGTDCETAGSPGRDNHQLPQSTEDDSTWTANDVGDTLWGCTWVAADVLDADFGMRWKHTTSVGSNVIGIDFIEMRINYTPP